MNERLNKIFSRDGKDQRWARERPSKGFASNDGAQGSGERSADPETIPTFGVKKAAPQRLPGSQRVVQDPIMPPVEANVADRPPLAQLVSLARDVRRNLEGQKNQDTYAGALVILDQIDAFLEHGINSEAQHAELVGLLDDLDSVVAALSGRLRKLK